MKPLVPFLLAIALAAAPAAAQDAPVVTLAAEDPPRWDVAAQAGWFGGNKEETAADWNDWYDAASFSVSAGYYWTPHLKIDLDLSTTTEGTVFFQEQIPVPGQTFPLFRYGEYRFQATTVSAAVLYQFLENTWFHPFAGAGVEATRERSEFTLQEQSVCVRAPCFPVPLPVPHDAAVSYTARPFVTTGFKVYVSERAFIRSDLQVSFSDRLERARWRAGMGIDF